MHVARRIHTLEESATLAVSALAAKLKSEGKDVIGLAAGEPDFPTPQHIVTAGANALRDGLTKYPQPASGLSQLKQAIGRKLKRENKLDYGTDQIVVTVGGKMACNLALQAILDPGDEVIIPRPYWVSYPEMVKLAGGVPIFVDSGTDALCVPAERIAAAITKRTRALIFNSPSNPGGHLYESHLVNAIANSLRGTNVIVLSDEIYDRLVFGQRECPSFAAVSADAYQRTITVNSASKTYSMTGWRIGFVAAPNEVATAVAKLQSQGTSGAPPFCQHAYAAALDGDQGCVQEMREAFAKRGRFVFERLNAMPGVRCQEPDGAFYAFPDVSGSFAALGVNGSVEFAKKLLDRSGVAVVPGLAFGMDSHVRISFATSMDVLEQAMRRLQTFLTEKAS